MFLLLRLQKADETVIRAAGDLRRQICETVALPKSAPLRFAFAELQRFNDRVVMDVFFIWDTQRERFPVVHAVDAFSMYQVAPLMPNPEANLAARFIKNYWVGVSEPPTIMMSDGSTRRRHAGGTCALRNAVAPF